MEKTETPEELGEIIRRVQLDIEASRDFKNMDEVVTWLKS